MDVKLQRIGMLITWATYGTWLPGDGRGWRRRRGGYQLPQPLLQRWCAQQMKGEVVLLSPADRGTVEHACREHAEYRGWELHAVNARTNHVHVVITADAPPTEVRNELKANCTRLLRRQSAPLNVNRTWARCGDCEILDNEQELAAATRYVVDGQDNRESGWTDAPSRN